MAFQLFGKGATAAEVKMTGPTGVVRFQDLGQAVWSSRDSTSLTRTGFLKNPVGFRAVKMIAEAAAAVPLIVQDHQSRFDAHPLIDLLRRPNTGEGGVSMLASFFGQLILTGNGFFKADWGDNDTPDAIHVLRSDRIEVVPGGDGWPVAYDYVVGKKRLRFDVTDERTPILHIKNFHPQDDHYGLSPLSAAASALDVHNAASQWSKALLDNAARPSGALVYKGTDGFGSMTDPQYRRLVDEIEANHAGARNAGRPMLLEGGLDWKPMGFSPSDMEFHRTKEAAAREIALAFGVPPMLLGLPGDNSYANYQEANRAFYRQAIMPLVTMVVEQINGWIIGRNVDGLAVSADFDALPALAPERDAKWKRINEADFLTQDEKRKLLGLPPREIAKREGEGAEE